MLTALH